MVFVSADQILIVLEQVTHVQMEFVSADQTLLVPDQYQCAIVVNGVAVAFAQLKLAVVSICSSKNYLKPTYKILLPTLLMNKIF